jgi:purine-binding chemotaxis protein CheW
VLLGLIRCPILAFSLMADRSRLRLLVWRAGAARFAAPLEVLREVVPSRAVTPIPGTPAPIRGLANVRGELITVVDGRSLVGAPDSGAPGALVLVRVGRRIVGLQVDDAEDLVTVADDAFQSTADQRGWTVRLEGGTMVRVLDLEALLAPLFPE